MNKAEDVLANLAPSESPAKSAADSWPEEAKRFIHLVLLANSRGYIENDDGERHTIARPYTMATVVQALHERWGCSSATRNTVHEYVYKRYGASWSRVQIDE